MQSSISLHNFQVYVGNPVALKTFAVQTTQCTDLLLWTGYSDFCISHTVCILANSTHDLLSERGLQFESFQPDLQFSEYLQFVA